MHFPDLNYDCVMCGKACGGWRVIVDDATRERLSQTSLARSARYEPFVPCKDGLYRMGFTPEDRCVFQREDKLCAVHAELGFESKPRACRQFPFFLVNTPDGPFVGMSFVCTAVQQNSGRPSSVHRPMLEELLGSGSYPVVGDDISLTPGHSMSWEAYQALEAFLRDADGWRMLAVPARVAVSTPWGQAVGVLDWSALPTPPRNGVLDQLEVLLLAGVIGCLEGHDLEEMRRVTVALQGGPCTIRRVPSPVSFACRVNAALEPEIRRYVEHLFHRKYLLLGHTVLSRLAAVYMARSVLRFYAAAFAGGEEPSVRHLHQAFEVVEGEMLTHAPDLEPYFQAAEDGLLRHL